MNEDIDFKGANLQAREPLTWGKFDPQRRRNTHPGMWAWIWQRISAIAIVVLLGLHIALTYKPVIQFLLLMTVVFHAALGIRVILLDFNIINVKYRNSLIASLIGLGLIVFILLWFSIYPL